jgi:hypothetical protein
MLKTLKCFLIFISLMVSLQIFGDDLSPDTICENALSPGPFTKGEVEGLREGLAHFQVQIFLHGETDYSPVVIALDSSANRKLMDAAKRRVFYPGVMSTEQVNFMRVFGSKVKEIDQILKARYDDMVPFAHVNKIRNWINQAPLQDVTLESVRQWVKRYPDNRWLNNNQREELAQILMKVLTERSGLPLNLMRDDIYLGIPRVSIDDQVKMNLIVGAYAAGFIGMGTSIMIDLVTRSYDFSLLRTSLSIFVGFFSHPIKDHLIKNYIADPSIEEKIIYSKRDLSSLHEELLRLRKDVSEFEPLIVFVPNEKVAESVVKALTKAKFEELDLR